MSNESTRKAAYLWCAEAIADCLGAAVIDGERALPAELRACIDAVRMTLENAGAVPPTQLPPADGPPS